MLFKRPKDLQIVDMCKIVDKLIHQDTLNENEKDDVIRYLYFIIYSISKNREYFYNSKDCDDFSIYLAEQLYWRFTDKDKEQIVSCRNYIDGILYGRILNWQQSDKFRELLEDSNSDEKYNLGRYIDVNAYKEQIRDEVCASDRDKIATLIFSEIENLPKIVENVSNHTQYKLDKTTTNNLYISCLLSLINGITLNIKLEEQIQEKVENGTIRDRYVITNRLKNLENSVILWHLEDEYTDVIKVLINRVKVMFIESINNVVRKYEVSPDILDAMLSTNGGDYRGKSSE